MDDDPRELLAADVHRRVRLASALSDASGIDDVAYAVSQWGAPAAAATFANLALFDAATNHVRVVHGPSLAAEIAQRWSEFPIDTPTPLCTAILTGHPILLADLEAITEHYPLLLDDTTGAGLQATASIPLKAADGSSIGAIGLAWPLPQRFDALQLRELDLITEVVTQAVQRVVARPDHSQQSVRALQEALLGRSFNHAPDLEVAATYLPASDAPMGGDWYDVFSVDELTCLVVGDIAGHGIPATAAMAELKHAVRAYAAEDPTPSTVVARINRLVHKFHPELTATLTVATWQTRTRTLWRCNAGHPPILRCRIGDYDYLRFQHGPQPMVGADPTYDYHHEAKQLRPDTVLLLYSDGLIESPPEPIDHTMERLLQFCEHRSSLSPQRLVNEVLLWRLRQVPVRDDVCLMAVRLP